MALFYNVTWERVGYPTAFIVARYDLTRNSWYVIDADGNDVRTLAAHMSMFNFNACLIPADDSSLIFIAETDPHSIKDYTVLETVPSHYQILQYHEDDGKYTQPITEIPTALDTHDNIINMRRKYLVNPNFANGVQLLDSNGDVGGSLEVKTVSSRPYADLEVAFGSEFDKTHMFEICGVTMPLAVRGNLLIADIRENVAVRF